MRQEAESEVGPLLEGRNVGRVYGEGDLAVRVLHPASFAARAGEVVVISGPSGSGKTTLLSILGLVLSPTEGEVWIDGRRATGLTRDELAKIRLSTLGFVFQQFNLLSGLSALENVALPLSLAGAAAEAGRERSLAALERVGLRDHAHKKPRQLSGGQQQRVAIARAIVADPLVVLCDEPTASLDAASGDQVLDLLRALVSEQHRAAVIVTHDERVLRIADRVVHVTDGHFDN
jgi:putative ABC transport system ATP-binding protein